MTGNTDFDLNNIPGIVLEKATQPTNKFSTLIYGRLRVGKTYLAASAAEVEAMSPVLWIAAESGTSSFAGTAWEDKIDVVTPTTFDDIQKVVNALTTNKTKYRTVVVDTLGEVQEIIKSDFIAKNKAMDFSGWAKVADGATWLVNTLHNSDYNSIFIAHADKVKDDIVGGMLFSPYFLGNKAIKDIPRLIDNIVYMAKVEDEKGNPVRVLQTQGNSRIDAGSRFENKLKQQYVNPSMKDLYEAITAK